MNKKTTTHSEPEMLHRMAAYCSSAERCINDVEKKLKAADLPQEACKRIISHLLKEKFIDEHRFCRSFIHDKLRFNKWGRIKINYELKMRNISPDIYQDMLDNLDTEEYREVLSDLLRSKKKSVKGKDNRDIHQKLIRFAAGRGFENKEIFRCLKESGYTEDSYE